jgi:membrane fusion protein (multidrug efflux system)
MSIAESAGAAKSKPVAGCRLSRSRGSTRPPGARGPIVPPLPTVLRSLILIVALALAQGCSKEAPVPPARGPVDVTVETVAPRDVPVSFEYVGQTQSSRQVQIVARVAGFLDRRVYTEGSLVKAGQLLFLQDPKPFQASLDAAKAALAQQQARLQTARDNLTRVRPLVALNALSKKDLDDATGAEQAAQAAVDGARASVQQSELNLGYTRIASPVTGLSSYAKVQDGAYGANENNLLTYVEQVDPIYANFSVSATYLLKIRTDGAKGRLALPARADYEVQVGLADGTLFPSKGRITFSNADFNQKTGTYLVRATLPNPKAELRPGQFVRVRVSGAVRPGAITVPQQAVLQGAKGHFVIVVDKEGRAEIRPADVGNWFGDAWFVDRGLKAGDVVVVDGMVRLSPGALVKASEARAPAASRPPAPEAVKDAGRAQPADKAAK